MPTTRKTRRIRHTAPAVLLASAGFTGLTLIAAPAANAAVDPASCVWGYNLSVPRISATCFANPNPHGWYLREACETPRGTTVYVNGTVVYVVGTGTSNAICPANTELGGSQLINL